MIVYGPKRQPNIQYQLNKYRNKEPNNYLLVMPDLLLILFGNKHSFNLVGMMLVLSVNLIYGFGTGWLISSVFKGKKKMLSSVTLR